MDLITKILKYFEHRLLRKWRENHAVPSKKRIKSVANGSTRVYTPEFDAFIDKAYIRRYYDRNPVCVDIYWHIKPSKKEKHIYTIHFRRDWGKIRHTIKKVEKHDLPRAMYEAFNEHH